MDTCDTCILMKGYRSKRCYGKIWNSAVVFYHFSRLVYDWHFHISGCLPSCYMFLILMADRVWRTNVCYNKSFNESVTGCWDIAIFKMSVIHRFGFLNSRNFNRWWGVKRWDVFLYHISVKLAAILDFQIPLILMADVLQRSQVHTCITMPNFVEVGQAVVEILQFFHFQDGGWQPSWIFKFQIS